MTDLPTGWRQVTLREVCEPVSKVDPVVLGRTHFQYVDIGSIESGALRVTSPQTLAIADAPGRARQLLASGDTVFSTVRPYLKKIAWVPTELDGEIASTGFCVLRPKGDVIHARFLFHFATSDGLLDQVLPLQRGVSYPAVRDGDVFTAQIPLPPLDEQRRIVAILEDHLSRLDAGIKGLQRVEVAAESLRKSIILGAIPDDLPSSWEKQTVDDVGDTRLGRQRHPDWHTGPNMHPYLRVANVFEDRIDANDVMEMDFTDCFDQFQLVFGDVLLNEGQSPHLLGRPAIYRGVPARVAFTNSLIRFRPGARVTSEWALLVFRHHMHSRRFMRESRITTNIAHLSLTRLKGVEFPVPPLDVQMRIVEETNLQLDRALHFRTTASVAIKKAVTLRRAMLAAAFSGQLTKESVSV